MKKKIIKMIVVIFLIILAIILIQNVSEAKVTSSDIQIFKGSDIDADSTEGKAITSIIGTILTVVRSVAIGIAIIMITFLGIQYMQAAPQEKANIKNKLITFTIGFVVVVSAVTLIDIARDFATEVIK